MLAHSMWKDRKVFRCLDCDELAVYYTCFENWVFNMMFLNMFSQRPYMLFHQLAPKPGTWASSPA